MTCTPIFFVTVHTQDIGYFVSKEMLFFSDKSTLISHAQASPKLIGQWGGNHYFMGHLLPWQSSMNGPSKDLVGPTVSHAAYHVIVQMGFTTILLGGVDLCFSTDDTTHAPTSDGKGKVTNLKGGDVRVLTNGGHHAETTFAFHRGILELGRMATHARRNGHNTFTFSPASAKIENVVLISPDQFSLSPSQRKNGENTGQNTRFNVDYEKHYTKVLDELNHALQSISEIRAQSMTEFTNITKMINEGTGNYSQVESFQKTIKSYHFAPHQQYMEVLNSFGIHFFNSLQPIVSDTSTHSPSDEALEFFKLYFTAVIVSADRLLKYIEGAEKRVRSRADEMSATPDIDSLLSQWIQDNQPSRAVRFLEKNPHIPKILTEGQRTQFQSFKKSFFGSLNGKDTASEKNRSGTN